MGEIEQIARIKASLPTDKEIAARRKCCFFWRQAYFWCHRLVNSGMGQWKRLRLDCHNFVRFTDCKSAFERWSASA
jgi:hypothetical protein